jgi:hypothetical protein
LFVFGREVFDDYFDWVEHHHLARYGSLEMLADRSFEAWRLDLGKRICDAELVDKVQHGFSWDTATAQSDHGEQSGIIPSSYYAWDLSRLDGAIRVLLFYCCAFDELEDASLRENCAANA